MTFDAIGREIRQDMFRFRSCVIFVLVAINAFNAQWAEQQEICRCIFMARKAVGRYMSAYERKPASLVYLGNVVHHPGIRGMASSAVGTNCLVVHIGVTGNTLLSCF